MPDRRLDPRPYLNPYVAGALLGVVLFAAFFVTGGGLGASGAINRLVAGALELVAPGHVDRVGYLAEMGGGTRVSLANTSVFMLLGTFLGGMIAGIANRRFRPELRRGPRISSWQRLAAALAGGVIMGFGARMARGCTSGQALSGGAVLSVGSFAFMFSVFIGGYAIAYFVRRLWT
jgi:uncharacterized membrane protein YedE/YeeE